MAVSKISGIKFGPGAFNNKNGESEWFTDQRSPYDGTPGTSPWNILTTYASGAAIVYDNVSYNSLQNGNIGNQPDSSPLWWSPVDGKDGDIWIQTPAAGFPTGGEDTDIYVKSSNKWTGLRGYPVTILLTDGQLTDETAFEFPASALYKATVEYTVRRGSGYGRQRSGKLEILNDGSSPTPAYSHEFTEIGSDVNVPILVDLSGGKVRIRYTSALEGNTITFRYIIRGWN